MTHDNLDWFLRHGHESAIVAGGYRVRVWAHGEHRPPVVAEAPTFDEALAIVRIAAADAAKAGAA